MVDWALKTNNQSILLLLRSYDHALDPESGSVDDVGGRHQVLIGAPKLVSQRCPDWPVLKSCFCVQKHAEGSVGLHHTGSFRCVTDLGVACGHAGDSVQFGV